MKKHSTKLTLDQAFRFCEAVIIVIEYAVITAVLFIPSIFIYYNTSACVYMIGYGIIALLGNLVSRLFLRR